MSSRQSIAWVLAIGLLWGVADQTTKYVAVRDLTVLFPEDAGLGERLALFYGTDQLYGYATPAVKILPSGWNHVYVQNPAGAFGLLKGASAAVRRTVFTGFAIAAALGILWMASRFPGRGRALTGARVALGLVFGGAIGNLLDRVVHGYVIDFVDWHVGRWHWPAFNVADVGIVVGVIGLLLLNTSTASEPAPSAPEADAPERPDVSGPA